MLFLAVRGADPARPATRPSPPTSRLAQEQYPQQIGNYLAHARCVNVAVERDVSPFARYPNIVHLQERLRVK